MDSYPDNHYPQRQQQQQQQQQQWLPHLLPPSNEYAQYYQQERSTNSSANEHRPTTATALSLNLSSLTVASPTNLSPINNPPSTTTSSSAASALSPVSPSTNPFQQQQQQQQQQHVHHHHHPHHHHVQGPFQFDPGSSSPSNHYETNTLPPSPLVPHPPPTALPPSSSTGGYDTRRTPAPSRSSSSSGIASAAAAAAATGSSSSSSSNPSSSQLPRKRSFTASPTSSSNPTSSIPTSNGAAPTNSPNHPRNQHNQGLTVNVNLSSSSSTTPTSTTSTTTLLEEEEPMLYDDEARDAAMELASSYDDMEVRSAYGVVGMGHHPQHNLPLSLHGLGHPHGMSGMPGLNFNSVGGGGMGSGNAGNGSPVDGSGSTSGAEDSFGPAGGGGGMLGMGGSMNILGKPLATNNFVTKLYQMINDPKSTQFIAWTELGTSFVVSNVGEFSRSILGSHFKHNNFSSFVRQLNMYGFHKINRTPRAQRTSTDAQTWEFSHHKFLRARPDLLDEIKRKALEPDPAIKHRVELPGEVAAQLGAMRDENRRMWDQLTSERRKVEKLVSVVGRLWDVVGKGFPGSVPPFPPELLETADSPNIYITSPTASTSSRFPPPLSMNLMHSLNSPNSSPTTPDFQGYHHHHAQHVVHHHHHPHSLSRQHSFQQHGAAAGGSGGNGYSRSGVDSNSSTPLPSSPGSITMDLFDDGSCDPPPPSGRPSTKRQRLDDGGVGVNGINTGSGGGGISALVGGGGGGGGAGGNVSDSMSLLSSVSSPGSGGNSGLATLTVPKKSSRARSDSAPLGYGSGAGASGLGTTAMHSWQQQQQQGGMGGAPPGGVGGQGNGSSGMGRPRSGSGMMPRIGISNMGRSGGNASTPLLSITTVESEMGGHPR